MNIKIPYTQQTISGSNLILIGSRPQMGISQFIIELIKLNTNEYDIESENPWCIFAESNEPILTEIGEPTLSQVNSCVVQFGSIRKGLIFNFESLFSKKPPFIVIHKFERLFNRYSSSSDKIFNLPNMVLTELKKLSIKYNVPVVITTFLHSSAEYNLPSFRPMLKDFGSSILEITADYIFALYRPNYYGFEENERSENIEKSVEIICLKSCELKEIQYVI